MVGQEVAFRAELYKEGSMFGNQLVDFNALLVVHKLPKLSLADEILGNIWCDFI